MAHAMQRDAAQPQLADVVGVSWQWQRTRLSDHATVAPVDPSRYTFEVDARGRLALRVDCNRGFGQIFVSGNQVVVGPLATTLVACPPGSLGDTFLQQLNDVTSFDVLDGDLVLQLRFGDGTMHFSRASQAGSVSGTVTYRERIALPPDAVVTVQLQDTARADAPALVLAEAVIETMGRQVPIPFSITYDPTSIDPRGRYTLSATITGADGRLRFSNTQAYPVITNGNPTRDIEIVVMRTGG